MAKVNLPKLYKNIAILASGTVSAQIIAILAYPLLSRVYNPDEFGVLAFILAVSSIVVPIATLRYESAIVIEKNDDYAIKIQMLCFLLLAVVSVLTLIMMVSFPTVFQVGDHSEVNKEYMFFSIPFIVLLSFINILSARLNRESMYGVLAKIHVLRKVGIVVSQLFFSLVGFAALGLVFGHLIGLLLAAALLLYFSVNFFVKSTEGNASLRSVALKHIDFPKYSAPQSLVNASMAQLPIIIFAAFYGSTVVGLYFFAMKIVQLPIMFLGQSVRTVFLKYASDNATEVPRLYDSFKTITFILSIIATMLMITLALYGADLFAFAFGEKWRQAGIYSGWLMIWFGGNLIQQPARSLFIVFALQKNLLFLDLVLGLIRLIGLTVCIVYYDVIAAIAVYSVTSFMFYVVTIYGWYLYLKRRL